MPGLTYPFVFECANCDRRITVDRDAVRAVFRFGEPDFNSFDTINAVLYQRGWLRDSFEHRIFCPHCGDPELSAD
jgi:hypothetical protein